MSYCNRLWAHLCFKPLSGAKDALRFPRILLLSMLNIHKSLSMSSQEEGFQLSFWLCSVHAPNDPCLFSAGDPRAEHSRWSLLRAEGEKHFPQTGGYCCFWCSPGCSWVWMNWISSSIAQHPPRGNFVRKYQRKWESCCVLSAAKGLSATKNQLLLQVLVEGENYLGVCVTLLKGSLWNSELQTFSLVLSLDSSVSEAPSLSLSPSFGIIPPFAVKHHTLTQTCFPHIGS